MKTTHRDMQDSSSENFHQELSPTEGLRWIQTEAFRNSKDKGFWDEGKVSISEKLMLIVTEVAEAMEAYRNPDWEPGKTYEVDGKLEGIGVELADVIIRCADLAEHLNIDLTELIYQKMERNTKRSFRHGNKRA